VGANTSIRGDRPCLFVSDLFLDIIVNAGMEKANVLPVDRWLGLLLMSIFRGLALNTLSNWLIQISICNSVQDSFFEKTYQIQFLQYPQHHDDVHSNHKSIKQAVNMMIARVVQQTI